MASLGSNRHRDLPTSKGKSYRKEREGNRPHIPMRPADDQTICSSSVSMTV